jgi:glycosyltransferase involved in cell wall biosynthesis
MWMNLTFGATAALFVAWVLSTLWHLRWAQRLPALHALGANQSPAPLRCSVVIAARDEEARIESTVRRLLEQRGVDLEIIVVDDRSRDRTGEILRQLAEENPRVRVQRVDVLPEGWLGKCHACHIGASAATSDWILFTDADCWMPPDVILRALRVAECENADHVAMASGIAGGSVGLKASHIIFLISLANWFSGVNRDRPKSFIGFGAFNLVRAAAYRESGGYEALRLTVLDDVKLGLVLRRAGKRTRGFIGGDDVECYWGRRAWDMMKLLEKNYFAAIDYRTWLVIAGMTFIFAVGAIVIAGLLSGTALGIAAGLSPLLLIAPGAVLARRLGWSTLPAILGPFMTPFFICAVLNSTFVTLRNGGIRWRETFYPLAVLRAGNVR